jgi:hypothetical protein
MPELHRLSLTRNELAIMGCLVGVLSDPLAGVYDSFGKDFVSVRMSVTELNQWDSPLFPGHFSEIPYLSQLI